MHIVYAHLSLLDIVKRGRIPFRWHAELIQKSRGKLKASDFIAMVKDAAE